MVPRLVWIVGALIGGYLGWWLGGKIGIMTGYPLSVVGAGLGVYGSFKLWRVLFP